MKIELRVAQALSLDVVLGVVCGAAMAASLSAAPLPAIWWFALPVSTWTVYSFDRLLDARRAGPSAHTFRHRFYHRHFGPLLRWTVLVLCFDLVAVALTLDARLLVVGIVLGAAVTLHLALAQSIACRGFPKELSAALVYTTAIWFAPLMLAPRLDPWIALPIGLHFLAALLNLVSFSLFEWRIDSRDGHASIVRSCGAGVTRAWVTALTAAGIGLAAIGVLLGPVSVAVSTACLVLVVVTPVLMLRYGQGLRRRRRYRLVGDLAFVALAAPPVVRFLIGQA